jgi:hypothetical protein
MAIAVSGWAFADLCPRPANIKGIRMDTNSVLDDLNLQPGPMRAGAVRPSALLPQDCRRTAAELPAGETICSPGEYGLAALRRYA